MLEAVNIIKKFGNLTAVDDVSFKVEEGEIVAFLGPNGAGKTTTIKMFTTLSVPTSGNVLINGVDPVKDPASARRSFGIVFQDQSLDEDLTAQENMYIHTVLYGVPNKERKDRIEKMLKFVELWDRKNELVKKFSGGMRRRLEIARALTHHPKILFLDEPTLGLDPQTRNHIWEFVKDLNHKEKMTVFFSTHYLEEAAKVADRIIIIDRGKIIGQGSPAALIAETGTETLEAAFLQLTGKVIREEEAGTVDSMRLHVRLRRSK